MHLFFLKNIRNSSFLDNIYNVFNGSISVFPLNRVKIGITVSNNKNQDNIYEVIDMLLNSFWFFSKGFKKK